MRFRGGMMLLLAVSGVATAQQPTGGGGGRGGEQRAELEARFRRQFARVVRARVGLTDDQMMRLAPINERYAEQRRRLQMDERSTRIALQRVLRGETTDTTQVATMLQQLVDHQKRRVALLEAEQRDLATIMTPMQRARYMALQEQVRRQVDQRRGGGGGQGSGRRRPPP